MTILNDKKGFVDRIISEPGKYTLNLGCGRINTLYGSIGVDIIDSHAVDIVGDVYEVLEKLPDSSVLAIYSSHFVEHLDDFKLAFNNLLKVSNKYVLIAFFKIPLEENNVITVNKHINNKDIKIKESMSGKKFITENPGFRNGFTKNCFYNIHNKNYIEDILQKNKLKFNWLKIKENELDTILLVIEI